MEDLKDIYNFLMRVEVKGESAIYLAESLLRLKTLIEKEDTTIEA